MSVKQTVKKASDAVGDAFGVVGTAVGGVVAAPIKFVGGAVGTAAESIVDVIHLKDALKKLFELLKEILSGKRAIAERLDEIEQQIQQNIDNGNYTQEQLDELNKTIGSLAGKLRNMSPEAMEETAAQAVSEIEDLAFKMYADGRLLDERTYEPDFLTALKKLSGHEDMDDKAFEKYFSENAKLFDDGRLDPKKKLGEDGKEHNQTEGTTYMLIELDGKCIEAKFDVGEPKPSEDNPDKKDRNAVITVSKFEGSYADAKEIKVPEELGAKETMMRQFLLPRGLRRQADFERIDVKRLEKQSTVVSDYRTIKKYANNVIESKDGKDEFTYDTQNNIFISRNKETGNALIFKMVQQELQMFPMTNTESLDEIIADTAQTSTRGASGKLGEAAGSFHYETGKGVIRFSLSAMDIAHTSLFRTPETMEFLSTKGVRTNDFLNTLVSQCKSIKGCSLIDREGLDTINRLKDSLSQAVEASDTALNEKSIRITTNFEKFKTKGTVYLTLSDKEGNKMSFSFDKDGTPRTLNYKPKDGNKFKMAQHLQPPYTFGADYEQIRYNPEFAQLLSVCQQAFALYQDKESLIEQNIKDDKAVEEATTKQAEAVRKWLEVSASSVTDNYYKDNPLLQASANYAIQTHNVSAARLQKEFSISHKQATSIIRSLEHDGLITSRDNKSYQLVPVMIESWKPTSFKESKEGEKTKPAPKPATLSLPEKKWITDMTKTAYPNDPLMAAIANFSMQRGGISVAAIHKEFKIQSAKAQSIIERLQDDGVLHKPTEKHTMSEAIKPSEFPERFSSRLGDELPVFTPLSLNDVNMVAAIKGMNEHSEKKTFSIEDFKKYGVQLEVMGDVYCSLVEAGILEKSDSNIAKSDSVIKTSELKAAFEIITSSEKKAATAKETEVPKTETAKPTLAEVLKQTIVPENDLEKTGISEAILQAYTTVTLKAGMEIDVDKQREILENAIPKGGAPDAVMQILTETGIWDNIKGINADRINEVVRELQGETKPETVVEDEQKPTVKRRPLAGADTDYTDPANLFPISMEDIKEYSEKSDVLNTRIGEGEKPLFMQVGIASDGNLLVVPNPENINLSQVACLSEYFDSNALEEVKKFFEESEAKTDGETNAVFTAEAFTPAVITPPDENGKFELVQKGKCEGSFDGAGKNDYDDYDDSEQNGKKGTMDDLE